MNLTTTTLRHIKLEQVILVIWSLYNSCTGKSFTITGTVGHLYNVCDTHHTDISRWLWKQWMKLQSYSKWFCPQYEANVCVTCTETSYTCSITGPGTCTHQQVLAIQHTHWPRADHLDMYTTSRWWILNWWGVSKKCLWAHGAWGQWSSGGEKNSPTCTRVSLQIGKTPVDPSGAQTTSPSRVLTRWGEAVNW